MELASSTIVEEINDMHRRGLASFGFFYCDFRDDDKKTLRGLVSSLLVQLCDHSDSYSFILSEFYSAHGDGSRQASDNALIECLRNILKHPGQAPVYIIIDGLDEFPNTSGMPSSREKVLRFMEELIKLHLKSLHVCITSRPEVDITSALNPFPFCTVSLHDEIGQKQDIVNYINSVVYTDVKMKSWRTEDKELIIGVLTKNAAGM
jgi:NACHT domain